MYINFFSFFLFFSVCDRGDFNTGCETQEVFLKTEFCTLHSDGAVKRAEREGEFERESETETTR